MERHGLTNEQWENQAIFAGTVREVEIGLESLRKVAVGKGLGLYSRRTL